MITIHNWKIVPTSYDPYQAPELMDRSIAGNVFNHPHFDDGQTVITSRIVDAEGRKVFTLSGSEYQLGKIDRGYRAWLRKERPDWNWKKPIKIL